MKVVSKSEFKAKALELFREVEATSQPIIISDRGKPKLKIVPFEDVSREDLFHSLRDSVHQYDSPLEPVGDEDWELTS